jgi:uncharacterized protein (DUF2147 family)
LAPIVGALVATICFATAFPVSANSVAANSVAAKSENGVWARDDGLVRARFGPCGDAICAVNIWVRNPEGSEKTGDRIVMSVRETSPDHWTGSAFDPQRDKTFTMDMNVEGARMTTRGCVLGGLVCKSVGWTRLSE